MTRFSALSAGIVVLVATGVAGGSIAIADSIDRPCQSPLSPGKASELVRVVDAAEEATPPQVSFPTPLVTNGTELSVVQDGSGVEAVDGSAVDFHVAAYLGSGGQLLTSSSYVEGEFVRRIVSPESTDFFSRNLLCAQSGDRIVITDTVESVFGTIPEDELVQNASTAVIVVDVLRAYPAQAEGISQGLADGVPMVVQHPSGRHGITIPMGEAPEELVVHTTIRGEGPVVQEGASVVAHYTGVVWETRQTFSSSFDQNSPLTVQLQDGGAEGATSGIISGIFQGLVGQTIGSQVVIVVPPSAGYPEGNQPPGVPEGATLVYVFDILGVE